MKVTFEYDTPLSGDEALGHLAEIFGKMAFVYGEMVKKGRMKYLFDVGAGHFKDDGSKFTISRIEP